MDRYEWLMLALAVFGVGNGLILLRSWIIHRRKLRKEERWTGK